MCKAQSIQPMAAIVIAVIQKSQSTNVQNVKDRFLKMTLKYKNPDFTTC